MNRDRTKPRETPRSIKNVGPNTTARIAKDQTAWYRSRSVVIVLFGLLLTWPFGLYAIWKNLRDPDVPLTWSMVTFGYCLITVFAINLILFGLVAGFQTLMTAVRPLPEPMAVTVAEPGVFGNNLGKLLCLPLPEQQIGAITKQETYCRCLRSESGHKYGEYAPSTIVETKGAPSTDHSYLSRRYQTALYKPSGMEWREIFPPLYILGWISTGLFIAFILTSRGDKYISARFWRSVWWERYPRLEIFSLVFGLTLVLGYSSGSSLVIDNATDADVEVHLNEISVGKLPGGHYIETRSGGGDTEVEIVVGGTVAEAATLKFDQSILQRLSRMLVGRGQYVYNIAGANSYAIVRPIYVPRGY